MSIKEEQSREIALEAAGVDSPLYAPRKKIFPQSISGTFRNIKWALLLVTLGIYYFLPFVRWTRGPNEPTQAVLLDMDKGRFYFFFIEIWPQEVYYITGLLILAAIGLFLMNAMAGRIWCGYLCPQTVWTDLFLMIERFAEGDRRERMMKQKMPLNVQRVAEITLKHSLWLMVAWWTGGAWVLYFSDAPTLVMQLVTFSAPMAAYIWILILTFTTYVFAGLIREQVCIYMCPWPRIQAALTDEHALNVTYRFDRGEPRGSVKKAAVLRAAGQPAGDCVDCNQCFNVCPTGVDIREGLQMDCIQCGLCIDACDNIMTKIGRPTGLIGYDTDLNVHARNEGRPEMKIRMVRPRTILYAAIIAVVGAIMLYALATRSDLGINAMHDRNPIYIRLSDGGIRNAYTVRILNKKADDRRFTITAKGIEGLKLDIAGNTESKDGMPVVTVGPDQTREMRVLMSAPANGKVSGSNKIQIVITDLATGATSIVQDNFVGP